MTEPVPADIDSLLLPVAVNMLSCLCAALAEETTWPTDAICCLRAGDSAIQDVGQYFDECCQGMAYVRPAGFYMTGTVESPFPSPSTDAAISSCGVPAWGLQLEIGVFRCIRTDRPLTCAEWTEAVVRQLADAKAMRAAVCCLEQLYDPQSVALGLWTPVGPQGGCLGSIWPISVQVDNVCENADC